VDDGKGRVFPCEGCGADLHFSIGMQQLSCPHCGFCKQIEIAEDATVEEQDFHAILAALQEKKESSAAPRGADAGCNEVQEVRCDSCGAKVEFVGTLTSTECPYCTSPIQREAAHVALDRLPVDGVLPFQVDAARAGANLKAWVESRWFLPNDLKKRGGSGKLQGVYLPFWTFDSHTANRYRGERGEHYYVTVGSGDDKRRERRIRWSPAAGSFQRFFDDVLVVAGKGLHDDLLTELEPWPLARVLPYTQQVLAGYLARTYDVPLDSGFLIGKRRMDAAIASEVRRRIGGDEQRVHDLQTRYAAIMFKHLLLPVWVMAYKYRDKTYQVVVNACTCEVQGERPYSWVKILLLSLAVAAAAGGAILLGRA
jgi:DNA-directed RNA polymerase subunit RPC12/RpoP